MKSALLGSALSLVALLIDAANAQAPAVNFNARLVASGGAAINGGKFNFYRPQLDLSGRLNAGKTLLYRLNAAYENADSFLQFNERERIFLAPIVTWPCAAI